MTSEDFSTILRACGLGVSFVLLLLGMCAAGRHDYSGQTVISFVMALGLANLCIKGSK
jgi:hypothetical protein